MPRHGSRALSLVLLLVACQGTASIAPEPKTGTYLIDNRIIALVDGSAEQPAAPGSASLATTRLTDRQAVGDVNNDGKPDTAVVLTDSGGGSGTFYMLSVLLNDGGRGKATNAFFLGDRVMVNSVNISGGVITVDYLDRGAGQPFAAEPSAPIKKKFTVKDSQLSEQH